MTKLLILFILFSCSSKKEFLQNSENKVQSNEEAISINLDFYKSKSKNSKNLKLEEVDEEEHNEKEIVNLISMLQSEEEKKFFDLGKKAPPPARYFILPVNGKLSSKYGMRKKRMHHGIDIPGRLGSPIKASNNGKVIFSGYQNGYGQVIILSHHPNIITLYAHNSKNLVYAGQIVKKSETIALMGSTGRSTGAHVHFEIRKNTSSIDPIKFIKDQHK